ncbi:MAG TPA: hypothetical protein VMV31_02960 [Terriglobales bacterium]|nr:hypothetical protein [Terriglobales bacterium]
MAEAVLLALGLALPEAERRVRQAGSGPETTEQEKLVAWAAGELRGAQRGGGLRKVPRSSSS